MSVYFNINANVLGFFLSHCSFFFIKAMLDVGQKRASDKGFELSYMSWLCADAQNLPLEDNSFDLYTIAFGIRNVTDVQKVLRKKILSHFLSNKTHFQFQIIKLGPR